MTTQSSNVYKIHPVNGRGHILIVDDDATTRKIIHKILDQSGYEVTEASSGEDALDYIGNHQFTLVLLDIVMKGINGIEVLKIIRQKYQMDELPVIMVTIKGSSSDMQEALALGANDYVVKPIDKIVLQSRIQNRISQKKLEDELRIARSDLEFRVEERIAELEDSKRYFQNLIENAQDMIAAFEEDGTVYYESPSVERVL